MEEKYLLSMIIPVYNCEAYLARCLDSLLAAGAGDMQIILVDDGSADGSGGICDEYAETHENITSLHKPNGGPSSARNLGLESAAGRYIGFSDSDDYVDPAALKRTLERLRGSKADIWVSDFYRVADNGTVLDAVCQIEGDEPITDPAYKAHFFSKPDCHWNIWRCIYRHEWLDAETLRFTEGVSCGEDLEFAVAAYMRTDNIVYYHNPYYFYRVNYGDTLMQSITAKRASELIRMLNSADSLLSGTDTAAEKLREKLAREYILNLSLYAEAAESEKAGILRALEEGRSFLNMTGGVYKPAAGFVKLFGIPVSSGMLLAAKRIKRTRRKIKQQRHR